MRSTLRVSLSDLTDLTHSLLTKVWPSKLVRTDRKALRHSFVGTAERTAREPALIRGPNLRVFVGPAV
jgi:hypothetical protein